MSQVTVEITLPAAPAQASPQAKRTVTVTIAGTPQPSVDVAIDAQTLPPFTADVSQTVQASVVEVLANGKQSAPCQSPAVALADHVDAVAADPADWAFKVTPVAAA